MKECERGLADGKKEGRKEGRKEERKGKTCNMDVVQEREAKKIKMALIQLEKGRTMEDKGREAGRRDKKREEEQRRTEKYSIVKERKGERQRNKED